MIWLVLAFLMANDTHTRVCEAPPEYYAIELVPTRRVPTAMTASGTAHLTFVESPFGIAVSPEGHYRYDVELAVENLQPVPDHEYVAWLATPDLKQTVRLGPITESVQGQTEWNKFLVFVTLEAAATELSRWQGPVVMRGLSRSGLMHTMAGHGPYEQEPCAVYGY